MIYIRDTVVRIPVRADILWLADFELSYKSVRLSNKDLYSLQTYYIITVSHNDYIITYNCIIIIIIKL